MAHLLGLNGGFIAGPLSQTLAGRRFAPIWFFGRNPIFQMKVDTLPFFG